LAELNCLLHKHFGTSDQAERFQTEMRTRWCKLVEELQQLYNEICRLMSLAYLGQSSTLIRVSWHDTFLEVLGDPSVCILDKSPTNKEEALHHALTLEALDKLRDAELEAMTNQASRTDKTKDGCARLAAQPRST